LVTHPKGQKYYLSASISQEIGKVLDERNKLHGIIKSFEVEQALRRYYGLDASTSLEQTDDGVKGGSQATNLVTPATPTPTPIEAVLRPQKPTSFLTREVLEPEEELQSTRFKLFCTASRQNPQRQQ